MKKCKKCGFDANDNETVCSQCGAELSASNDLQQDAVVIDFDAQAHNFVKSASNKFNSFSNKAKKRIVIASLVIAYLLGIGSHMLVGVKRSDYKELLASSQQQEQDLQKAQQTINTANDQIKQYESIIQPYKDLSAAQIAEQTAASNLKAAQDQKQLEEQKAAEEKVAAEKAAAEKAAAEKAAAEKAAAEKAAAEKAAAEAAKGYETGITYNQLARTPDNYIGKKVKFKGKVVQVIEGSSDTQIRLAVNSNYDNILYASVPKSKTANMRILKDDVITIFGVSNGLITYKSTLGGNITIPSVTVDDWGPN